MNPSRKPHLLLTSLLSLAACELPDKLCIGDCVDPGPNSSTTGDTFDPPDEGMTTDDVVDVCAIDQNFGPEGCSDGVQQPGEFCFVEGVGGLAGPVEIVSAVSGRFGAGGGADFLMSHPDRTVNWMLDGPQPFLDITSGTWPQVFPADALVLTGAGDLDGDGHLDAVGRRVGGSGDTVEVLFTDGAAQLADSQSMSLGTLVFGPEVLDWDQDGDLDLLVVTPPEDNPVNVIVLRGDGAGEFEIVPQFGRSPVTDRMAVGALGADGVPNDYAWAGESEIDVLLTAPGDTGLTVALAPGSVVHDLAIAELDGDGLGDIVALVEDPVGGGTSALVLLQTVDELNDPAFVATAFPVRCGATRFALGDIDQDGALDLVAGGPGDGSAAVTIRRGDGTGGFPQVTSLDMGPADEVHIADFTGNGSIDIAVVGYASGSVTFAPNAP